MDRFYPSKFFNFYNYDDASLTQLNSPFKQFEFKQFAESFTQCKPFKFLIY